MGSVYYPSKYIDVISMSDKFLGKQCLSSSMLKEKMNESSSLMTLKTYQTNLTKSKLKHLIEELPWLSDPCSYE